MKTIISFLFAIFYVLNVNAQSTNLSLEVSYPLTVDKNFVGDHYRGTIDFGVAYRFRES
jgi:hypothetical protein